VVASTSARAVGACCQMITTADTQPIRQYSSRAWPRPKTLRTVVHFISERVKACNGQACSINGGASTLGTKPLLCRSRSLAEKTLRFSREPTNLGPERARKSGLQLSRHGPHQPLDKIIIRFARVPFPLFYPRWQCTSD
jgi:hypothetical protein